MRTLLAAEDRAERRRKLGLPELTPDDLAAEAAKEAAEKASKAKSKAKPVPGPVPVKPISVVREFLIIGNLHVCVVRS